MSKLSIDQVCKVTGRTRRSVYRAMAEGRLSYQTLDNGRRVVDLSEVQRAYKRVTVENLKRLNKTSSRHSDDEVVQLRAEVAELKAAYNLLLQQQQSMTKFLEDLRQKVPPDVTMKRGIFTRLFGKKSVQGTGEEV